MAFASLMTAQLIHTRRCRSHAQTAHRNLDLVLAGSFALQAIALGVPAVRTALGGTRLAAGDLGIALGLGLLPSMRPERLIGRRRGLGRGEIVLERRDFEAGAGRVGIEAEKRPR